MPYAIYDVDEKDSVFVMRKFVATLSSAEMLALFDATRCRMSETDDPILLEILRKLEPATTRKEN